MVENPIEGDDKMIQRPFKLYDLVMIKGYGSEVYQIVGKNTSRSYDPIAGVIQETIYGLTNVDNPNDYLKGYAEDMNLVAHSEDAFTFLQRRKEKSSWQVTPEYNIGATERHKASLRSVTISQQAVPESDFSKHKIQAKIDELLDWYGDVLTLNAVLGTSATRNLRLELLEKEINTLSINLGSGFYV